MNKITIEVWSDVVCPSCYIGMKQIEQAISNLQVEDRVELVLRSFQLDPNFPENQSMSSLENLAELKGYGMTAVKQMCERIHPVGKSFGIDFQFDKALIYNTRNAHRLIHWSKSFGKSLELEEALFKAYFCDGIDLSDLKNMLQIIELTGLNRSKAKSIIEGNEFEKEVNLDLELANSIGVRGVPYFLFAKQKTVSGYQQDGVFEELISNALNNSNYIKDSLNGNSCSIDSGCD